MKKIVLLLLSFIFEVTLFGDFIMYDDFNGQTLDMDKWDTLAWAGGYEPYIENNGIVFKGSDNVSGVEGSLSAQFTEPLDSSTNSAILYKGEALENLHGIEVEFTLSSNYMTHETGLGVFVHENNPLSGNGPGNGFGMDLWNNQGTLNVEFSIEGGNFQQGDSRFQYVSPDTGTGYVKFISNVAYDTVHKVAYILSEDGLVFYYNGVEVARFADYDHTIKHERVVVRGCNENIQNFLGYADNFKFFRSFFDTDSDGLHDEDETNTGVFISNRNTGTDPNNPDTSGDGLKDGVVVSAGFDPTVDYSNLVNASRQGMTDLRAGSTMVEVSNNQATIQLQMEESSDLQSWTETGDTASMTIPVPAEAGTKFFRFKMAD